ncbi:MAG: 50S ribosomal protein L5 [Candidatus Woesearchaeota archaeon]
MSDAMKAIRVEKLTLNMGAGTDHGAMEKAVKLLKMITGIEPVKTKTSKRVPGWGLRPGLPIGCKITLRGQQAQQVIDRLLVALDKKLPKNAFDNDGNISFGLKEYLDIPGVKYDQSIGIIGLQVTITLDRPGFRVKKRSLRKARIPLKHRIPQQEAIAFAKEQFKITLREEDDN